MFTSGTGSCNTCVVSSCGGAFGCLRINDGEKLTFFECHALCVFSGWWSVSVSCLVSFWHGLSFTVSPVYPECYGVHYESHLSGTPRHIKYIIAIGAWHSNNLSLKWWCNSHAVLGNNFVLHMQIYLLLHKYCIVVTDKHDTKFSDAS